jgi:nitrogen regulatory protein P-II 2
MQTQSFKLVTIIAEPVLEHRITAELRALGASGFTVVEGRGSGSRGLHAAEIPGTNVRIETLVTASVADAIITHVSQHYFTDYGVIAFIADVAVIRGGKYDTPGPNA